MLQPDGGPLLVLHSQKPSITCDDAFSCRMGAVVKLCTCNSYRTENGRTTCKPEALYNNHSTAYDMF